MHRWLLANRIFGEYIRNIENNNGIPRRAKIMAIALLWVSLLFSIYKFEPVIIRVALIAIGVAVTVWLLRMKTLQEPPPDRR